MISQFYKIWIYEYSKNMVGFTVFPNIVFIIKRQGQIPTKRLYILVTAPVFLYLVPYLHKFSKMENESAENALVLSVFDYFALYLSS